MKRRKVMRKALTIILALAVIFMFACESKADQTATAVVEDVNASAGAEGYGVVGNINSGNTNEAMERGFPVPGQVRFGPVINYYGKPLPSAAFRPVESLLAYGNVFSEGALKEIVARGANIIHELEIVRGKDQQVRAKYEKKEVRWIKIVATTELLKDHGLIGYVTSEANNRKTSMLEVMARGALDALCAGADVLQIVAQGASRDTETSGWGIGFNTTQASMVSGNSGANVSSFGTGYSQAWGGMRDKPWIQANAMKAPTKIVGVLLPKPEPKKKAAKKTEKTSKKVSKADKKKSKKMVTNINRPKYFQP